MIAVTVVASHHRLGGRGHDVGRTAPARHRVSSEDVASRRPRVSTMSFEPSALAFRGSDERQKPLESLGLDEEPITRINPAESR